MAQIDQFQSLKALSKVCKQLSDAVTTAPMEKMEQQLNQYEQQTQSNLAWLDEAFDLLSSVSQAENTQQLPQIITKIENFVSKSSIDDYASTNHVVESSRHLSELSDASQSSGDKATHSKNN